jgi:hypothetical protein
MRGDRMNIAKRIEALEQIRQGRDVEMPLLDFRWEGPAPRNHVTFAIDGHGIVDHLDDESDVDYRARAFALCKALYKNRRELPVIKVFLPG